MSHYDVIIIGGRPAGSTLAARLGKQKLNVLLLERATFPSLPAASSPIVYAGTLSLLDEIGADERKYARDTPKIKSLYLHSAHYQMELPIPEDNGRDYGYAVDRARFDHALWETAASYPTVTAWQNFHVVDLLWDGDTVIGITGKSADGITEEITADLVVGADGRFGIVARKVNAENLDEHDEFPTTLHYAYWKNLKPYNGISATSVAYEGEFGLGYLVMDSAENTAAVCVEGRADMLEMPPGQAEAFYLAMLQKQPALWERLDGAKMVTKVRGMKKITNRYRQPGGKGWALVGDAYHQKDPLDGQGIYNAVFTSKALAWAIRYWRNGEKTWEEALEWYDETARIKTYPMYKSLMNRVKMSFYAQPNGNMPAWLQDNLARWTMEDPAIQNLMSRYITRQVPPDMLTVMLPTLTVRAAVRGSLQDLQQRVRERLPFVAARS